MAEKKVKRPSLLRRILVFILTLLLGMALMLGLEIGGIYALVSWVTIDNVGINADGFLEEDSPLREMSLIALITELNQVSAELSTLSFNDLMDNYGVILPESLTAAVPAEMLDLPLSHYAEDGVLNVFLQHATVGNVLSLVGEDVLPEAAQEKMRDRTLDLLMNGELGTLFGGVYVGDLMGIAVEKGEDGVVDPVLGEDEDPTIMSYIATLDVGEYLGAEDGFAVLQKTLDRTPMDVILEGGDGNVLYKALADKTLGDVLKMEDGGFYFDLDTVMEDMYLGDVLGFTLGDDGIWRDGDDKAATGINRELVGIKINELGDTDLLSRLDNVYVAELMGYERVEVPGSGTEPVYKFYKVDDDGNFELDSNGNKIEPEGMTAELATLTVAEIRTEETLNAEIRGMQIGTVMGYTEGTDGIWRDEDTNAPATGVVRPLLGSTVDSLDEDINSLYLGEVMGFDNVGTDAAPVFKKDGNSDGDYDDAEDSVPSAFMTEFADMKLKNIENESEFTSRVKGVRVGDAMGYTLDGGVWYEGTGTEKTAVTGIFRTLSGYKVSELNDAVKTLSLADAMGYTKSGDQYLDENNVAATGILALLMESSMNTLSTDVDKIYLGEIMGYTNVGTDAVPVFKKDGKAPTGVIAEFADLRVKDLEDDTTITGKIEGMEIGTAMGYIKVGTVWYSAYTDDEVNNDTVLSPDNHLLAAIIDTKVSDIDTKMHSLTLADVLAYEYTPPTGSTLTPEDEGYYEGGTWKTKTGGEISGFMKLLHPQTPIDEIEGEVNRIQTTATIGEFVDSGALVLNEGYPELLDTKLGTDWRTYKLSEFVNALIAKLVSP